MEGWEAAVLVAAGYVAVVSLVRMMIARRETVLARFRAEVEQEKRRLAQQKRRGGGTSDSRAA